MTSLEKKRRRRRRKKKNKKKKKKEPSPTLTSLPDDLLLSCLAQVSRLYYPTLSLVSKRFRSLLVSPELYKVRSLLGNTESCLYVCIEFYSDPKPSWYTLCRKPNQTLTNSSGYVLAKVPIPDSPPVNVWSLVAVGSSIYSICGSGSNVSFLDCTSHMWREAPSFPVEPWSLSASVLDQNLYVAGCYHGKDDSSKNTFQVFDTKTQIWSPIPIPCIEEDIFVCSACIDGRFHLKTSGRMIIAYNSKEGRWDLVESKMGIYMRSKDSCCVIENVLYTVYGRDIKWYDTKVSEWKNLKGLVGLPKLPCNTSDTRVRLADYGGKMMVLWDENNSSSNSKKNIWCAEIVLERLSDSSEILGIIEWFDHVLTVPSLCHFIEAFVPTTV